MDRQNEDNRPRSSGDAGNRLPLRGSSQRDQRTHSRIIIAHHLVLTGYGHWLPNDLRGSGSDEIRNDELKDLGSILPGRQPVQPSRQDLKDFYRRANPLLKHESFWFDPAKRQALADAFERAARDFRYTVWACAVCSNHAHFCVRRHRDQGHVIWDVLAGYGREALRRFPDVGPDHPVWSDRPYTVFLYTPEDVRGRIGYVNSNPMKEGLARQHHPFVLPYDGWPHPRRQR